jgi:hypothetical protein
VTLGGVSVCRQGPKYETAMRRFFGLVSGAGDAGREGQGEGEGEGGDADERGIHLARKAEGEGEEEEEEEGVRGGEVLCAEEDRSVPAEAAGTCDDDDGWD